MTNRMHLDASSRPRIMQAAVAFGRDPARPCAILACVHAGPPGTYLLLNWSLKTWPRAKAAQLRNSAVDQRRAACDVNRDGCRVRAAGATAPIQAAKRWT